MFNGKTNRSARITGIHRGGPCPCRQHARLHMACQSHRVVACCLWLDLGHCCLAEVATYVYQLVFRARLRLWGGSTSRDSGVDLLLESPHQYKFTPVRLYTGFDRDDHRCLLGLWPFDQPDLRCESSSVPRYLVGRRRLWRPLQARGEYRCRNSTGLCAPLRCPAGNSSRPVLLSRSVVDAPARSLRIPGCWRSVASAATTCAEVIPATIGSEAFFKLMYLE